MVVALDMSEADLQACVIDTAHLLGWRVAHFRPGMNRRGQWQTAVAGDGAGFPDLVLVRNRVIFVELKAAKGRLRDNQVEWMEALRDTGAWYEVWRPEDWRDGTIEKVLR